jgi:hypothetical protein
MSGRITSDPLHGQASGGPRRVQRRRATPLVRYSFHWIRLSATARAEPPLKTNLATMIGNSRRPNA